MHIVIQSILFGSVDASISRYFNYKLFLDNIIINMKMSDLNDILCFTNINIVRQNDNKK